MHNDECVIQCIMHNDECVCVWKSWPICGLVGVLVEPAVEPTG